MSIDGIVNQALELCNELFQIHIDTIAIKDIAPPAITICLTFSLFGFSGSLSRPGVKELGIFAASTNWINSSCKEVVHVDDI